MNCILVGPIPLQDEKVRRLFALIKELRKNWAFAEEVGEVPPLNLDPAESVEDDPENYDDASPKPVENDHKPERLERKGGKESLSRSSSSLSSTSKSKSSPNDLLKGMGIDVEMTEKEAQELHEVLKQINELDPPAVFDPELLTYLLKV